MKINIIKILGTIVWLPITIDEKIEQVKEVWSNFKKSVTTKVLTTTNTIREYCWIKPKNILTDTYKKIKNAVYYVFPYLMPKEKKIFELEEYANDSVRDLKEVLFKDFKDVNKFIEEVLREIDEYKSYCNSRFSDKPDNLLKVSSFGINSYNQIIKSQTIKPTANALFILDSVVGILGEKVLERKEEERNNNLVKIIDLYKKFYEDNNDPELIRNCINKAIDAANRLSEDYRGEKTKKEILEELKYILEELGKNRKISITEKDVVAYEEEIEIVIKDLEKIKNTIQSHSLDSKIRSIIYLIVDNYLSVYNSITEKYDNKSERFNNASKKLLMNAREVLKEIPKEIPRELMSDVENSYRNLINTFIRNGYLEDAIDTVKNYLKNEYIKAVLSYEDIVKREDLIIKSKTERLQLLNLVEGVVETAYNENPLSKEKCSSLSEKEEKKLKIILEDLRIEIKNLKKDVQIQQDFRKSLEQNKNNV